jgi:hypothetical protein
MADNSRAAFLQARQCWPDRGQDERILAPAKQIYEAWQAASADTRRIALDAAVASGLTWLPGKDSERAQCRDLTLFSSPLPGPPSALRPLTSEQVEALGVVPPSTGRPRRAAAHPARSLSAPPLFAQGRGSDGGPRHRARARACGRAGARPGIRGPIFARWRGFPGETGGRRPRSLALSFPFPPKCAHTLTTGN